MVDFPTEIGIGYLTNKIQKPYPLIQPAVSPIGTVALNFADKILPAASSSLYCQVVFQELLQVYGTRFHRSMFCSVPSGPVCVRVTQ
jgi:hypothetical protein